MDLKRGSGLGVKGYRKKKYIYIYMVTPPLYIYIYIYIQRDVWGCIGFRFESGSGFLPSMAAEVLNFGDARSPGFQEC